MTPLWHSYIRWRKKPKMKAGLCCSRVRCDGGRLASWDRAPQRDKERLELRGTLGFVQWVVHMVLWAKTEMPTRIISTGLLPVTDKGNQKFKRARGKIHQYNIHKVLVAADNRYTEQSSENQERLSYLWLHKKLIWSFSRLSQVPTIHHSF